MVKNVSSALFIFESKCVLICIGKLQCFTANKGYCKYLVKNTQYVTRACLFT